MEQLQTKQLASKKIFMLGMESTTREQKYHTIRENMC